MASYRLGSLVRAFTQPKWGQIRILQNGCRVSYGGIRSLSTASVCLAKAQRKPVEEDMFCFQCEQTKLRKGCTTIGVCGKLPEVAALQDLLVHVTKGLCLYSHNARLAGAKIPEVLDDFVHTALFSTLTNVNFDPDRFTTYIEQAIGHRNHAKQLYEDACKRNETVPRVFNQDQAVWVPSGETGFDATALEAAGRKVGVQDEKAVYGDDIHGVRQMIIYGLKGMSTYALHARRLGHWDESVARFTQEAFAFLIDGAEEDRHDLVKNLEMALRVGEANLKGMSLLDAGHRSRFGVPSPTEVRRTPLPGKCILVSGHDMHDLEHILKAVEGKGINVYTHGEMLPAHGHPELRKYKSLAGHFGGAWQLQKYDWAAFPGPIVITTNCLVEPMKSYKDRLFTLNETGWPEVKHLDLERDINQLIEKTMECDGFHPDVEKEPAQFYTVGFGRDAIVENAGTVIDAVQSGELKRVFVIGGCDGAENKRNYFTTLADSLPSDTLILTLGCAKFRLNKLELGNLGNTGLPRLLDVGQCNDAYGAVVVAQALADAFKTDINSLPLSIALSWFEQKAVAVLLTMLHLGVKNIRLGPVLPAFITPNVLNILVDKYGLQPVDIRHPKEDMELMMQGQ